MPRLKILLAMTTILGILSLAALAVGHLALTDIHHGEANVGLEWGILRACAAVFLAFIIWTLLLVRNVGKKLPPEN